MRYEKRQIERARTAKMSETVTRPSLLSAFYASVLVVGAILFDLGMQTESGFHIAAGLVFVAFGVAGLVSQVAHVLLFRRFLISSTKIVNEYEVEDAESEHREARIDNGNDTFVLRRDPKPIRDSSVILQSRELLAFTDQLDTRADERLVRPEFMSGTRFQNVSDALVRAEFAVREGRSLYPTMSGENFIRAV
jgi:hypothetical protein